MSKPRINFLSEDEIRAIHNASLKVLENTGIRVTNEAVLDILKKAGAGVDYVKKHVTIPRGLVEEALRRAPKTTTYAARNPKYDVALNKQKPHFWAEGGAPFIVDWETGERRYSRLEDTARWAVLADYLDHFHFLWPVGQATDVPLDMRGIVGMCTALRNTEKHVGVGASSARAAQYQIEIAAAIVGGREQLRKRPIISANVCPISPLSYEQEITEATIEYAEAGLPILMWPMPLMGETSPATLSGTMVVNNAEVLAGLTILEFASPGAPVVYTAGVGTVDFRTGSGVVSPEGTLMNLALAQLAYHYDLPMQIGSSGSASKTLDIQAGYDDAISLVAHLLIVPDMVMGFGSLDTALTSSPEALVIDNEIIDYALRFGQGLEVNDETLAVDVIDKVGPGGIYLGEKHTLKHFRERWMSRLSDIDSFETWQKKGSKSIGEVAHQKVKEILATHKPEPMPEGIEREISRILKRAELELLK